MDNLILMAMWAVGLLILFVVLGVVISSLYKRASKERSFVRTGFGGEHVVINGGALILPVLHDTIDVNMNTLRLEVRRVKEEGLITNDRLRVDVTAEFYVRVQPTKESIAAAAQTLGTKTMDPTALKELVEGKFVDALRAVAAGMKMEELHEQRVDFVTRVQQAVSEDLLKNGLELESVSLTGLDQTNKEFLNPENIFDAEGLTLMTRQIEERRKIRNDIEQETQVQIAQKNLTAQSTKYEIERNQETVRLDNERQTEERRAQQGFEIGKAREEARRQTRAAEISANQSIEIAEQESKIAVANKSEETSKADAQANAARAEAVRSEEQVVTARATEVAERTKSIQLIEASQEAETKSIGIVVQAQAEREAAENRAAAIKVEAEGLAEAEKTRASGAAETYRVEAEGQRNLNEAANLLNAEQIAMRVRVKLIESLPEIIAQSVKPLENIDGIKILHVDGMGGFPGAGGSDGGSNGNLADSIASAALRYRSQAPLIDSLLGEIGIDGKSLGGMTDVLLPQESAAPVAEAPAPAPAVEAAPARPTRRPPPRPSVEPFDPSAAG